MREIQSTDATFQLPAILDAVERGETVAITRHGRRIARLVPEPAHRQERAARAVEALRAFGQRHGPVPVDELVADRREGQRG